jgi:nitroreductase
MSFLELAQKRYSVRSYQKREVEPEKIKLILEAGRVAPTGANFQPQRLLVIQTKDGLEKLKNSANLFDAPLAIIVCGDSEDVWKRPYDGKSILDIDVSIVTDHMMLQATELDLGTIWVCYFKPDILRRDFNIPKNLNPINILGIGYASGEPAAANRHNKTRKPLIETAFFNSFD